ncbi:hypothetical protein Mapa_016682 [Marchantia paleacea]|nr:hypothetical protein Mapa_016682 [Marchantia paleacea]
MEFIKKYILEEMKCFCASDKGCPGVQLQVCVLCSASVKQLIPFHERTEKHCVMLHTLYEKFRNHNQQQSDSPEADENIDYLLDFEYSWPLGGSDRVRDLIGDEDLQDVLTVVQGDMEWNESHSEVDKTLSKLRVIQTKLCQVLDPQTSTVGNSTPEGSVALGLQL